MRRTILVVAGYGSVAEWMCQCLEADSYLPSIAKDTDAAFRLAFLLDIDLIVAWPAVSGFRAEEFLAAFKGHPEACRIPILLVVFQHPSYEPLSGLRPFDGWVRAPLAADELLLKVSSLLDRASPSPSTRSGPQGPAWAINSSLAAQRRRAAASPRVARGGETLRCARTGGLRVTGCARASG